MAGNSGTDLSDGNPAEADAVQPVGLAALRAERLNVAADETNDAYDHDELHAAADVVRAGLTSNYIDRWVEGLERRCGITAN